MNITEATAVLREAKISTSEEVVRRWCREEVIPATRQSRRQGWQIEATDLNHFIRMRKNKPHTEEYKRGYADAADYYKMVIRGKDQLIKELLGTGATETVEVSRKDIEELAPTNSKDKPHDHEDYMKVADDLFFRGEDGVAETVKAYLGGQYIKIGNHILTDEMYQGASNISRAGTTLVAMANAINQHYYKISE
jgi:hypothetical protein